MEKLKDVVIIYHAQCPDGFGSAYSAWKKFGDTASYLPLKTQSELPSGLNNKEIYILDYSFDKPTLEQLSLNNRSIVVIDHHRSAEATVTSFPQNIFDLNHSGAVLSWQYFHPDTEVPELLNYIEDHDLWKFSLPKNREFNSSLTQYPPTFENWDQLINNLKDETFKKDFLEKGSIISKFEDSLVDRLIEYKELVSFEGHEVWALNVSRIYRSILGHHLATINQTEGKIALGIVYYRNKGLVHVSLRSNGDVDVSAIAQKYGGGGHKNASAFKVNSFAELPFTFI
jgi:oligoribonuclease NrnB/cAMP/cGMP phosphodiesterase (DHH superfamily)